MKFKGTIIITDPCYITRNDYTNDSDDWVKCEYGQNMEALGISHYICKDTIYGDWSCTTFQTTENPYYNLEALKDAYDSNEYVKIDCPKLGQFCSDSSMVAVFNLDEVRKYNSDIDEWIASHSWCVTIIPDFDGEVNYYVDRQDSAHIVGIGNINFFTVQTGL